FSVVAGALKKCRPQLAIASASEPANATPAVTPAAGKARKFIGAPRGANRTRDNSIFCGLKGGGHTGASTATEKKPQSPLGPVDYNPLALGGGQAPCL